MYNIATIVGSLRKESFNKKLAQALIKLSHPELQFNLINLAEIPIFNQDNEQPLPTPVAEMKNAILKADGVLFVTPEYNRSIPGVLKNIIDWGTRPYGQNCWKEKPTAVIGASPGAVATAVAQSHLRSIMVAIGSILMGLPEIYFVFKDDVIDEHYDIADERTKKFLQGFLNSFAEWVAGHIGRS